MMNIRKLLLPTLLAAALISAVAFAQNAGVAGKAGAQVGVEGQVDVTSSTDANDAAGKLAHSDQEDMAAKLAVSARADARAKATAKAKLDAELKAKAEADARARAAIHGDADEPEEEEQN